MSTQNWRWKLGEAVERLKSRYEFIGRKTGAPFLAIVYPSELEVPVLKEWRMQCAALQPEIDVRPVDVLVETQKVVSDIGVENIVGTLQDPMPGSDPHAELGMLWVNAVAEAVVARMNEPGQGKPAVSLERVAALYPVAGPRDVMQRLWDSSQSCLAGPVVVLIPGELLEPRTYSFVSQRVEFMYRGDLL